MPRRKRTTAQNEKQRKVRRTDNNEDTLVISDSENEEEEDCAIKLSSRAARWRDRGNRVQIQDMTEDEMLDLAMRLSKQEANTAAQRQQLEDDDMRKAIAESLHVSNCQDQEADSEPDGHMTKTQDPHAVMGPLRRKLSFPSKKDLHSTNSGDDAVAVGEVDSTPQASPLLPMPDLSQRTSSQPLSLCPTLPSVPSTSSQQERPSSEWKDEVLDADSSEDKPSQSNSQLQCSPAFLRKSNVQPGQDMLKASGNPLSTNDCSPDLTRPNSSQLARPPSPLESPKTDPKGGTELSGNKDSDTCPENVCSPNKEEEETVQKSSSHKSVLQESRTRQKRFSLSRKAQPLTLITVPDGNDGGGDISPKQESLKPNRMKEESTHGTSLTCVFERSTNSEKMLLPEETKSFQEFSSHMVLHLSDDDDDDEEVVDPSPVFRQEMVSRARPPSLSPTQPCCSLNADDAATTTHTLSRSNKESTSQGVLQRKNTPKMNCPAESDQREAPGKLGAQEIPACDARFPEAQGERLVSYYWGVPFCPRGQNPDDYTRVILGQLEVYEKSLKAAQRGLLHKVDWGLPVFPCPAERSLGRRFKRHRAPQLLDEDDDNNEEREQQHDGEKKDEMAAGEEMPGSLAGPGEGARDGPSEPYVVVSSPEPQEELTQKSPLLFGPQESMDACKPSRKSSPREGSRILQPDEHEESQHKQCDVESTVCPESQLTEDSTPELMVTSPVQPQSVADSEVMEVDEEENPLAIEEDRMEQGEEQEPGSPLSQTMACPMCCKLFTRHKIEFHAAYCDGSTPEQSKQQVPVLQKKAGRTATGEASPSSEKSKEREKCYLCLKFFSRDEYHHHVPQCLHQKKHRLNKGNGLLAALDQTEKGHIDVYGAGPSDSTTQNSGLADASLMAEAGGSRSEVNFCVSSSPIKSFTPISEATDCLIDFRQQYSARPSQRQGRKRKFKR